MPILNVRHLTRYRYRRPVAFGEHRLMMRPLESYDQRVLHAELVITPEPVELRSVQDPSGNCVVVARFARRARQISFESRVRLDHAPAPPDGRAETPIDLARPGVFFAYPPEDLPELTRSISRARPDPEGRVERWARDVLGSAGPSGELGALSAMTRAIHTQFVYAKRLYGPAQPPLETLGRGSGTCRDFAVLLMEAARSLGFAARFVSGYVYTSADQGPRRAGGGHTHAWARVYLPSYGWVDFDPTNGIVGATDLIRVAVVTDPPQAAPLVGSYDGEAGDFLGMDVEVDVAVERGTEREPVRALMAA